jgi:hypothetical protein
MLIPAASDNQTRQSCLPSVVAVFILIDARFHPDCRATDAEVVGDLVAVDMPVPRHLLAQKSQYHTSEILEPSVAFVVSAVPVHQTPQSFDRVQMWAV